MKRKLLVSLLITMLAVLTISSCGIANKAVSTLQIISGAPTEVEVGKTPDFSELLVKVTYNDNTEKEVGFSDVTISKIDTSKPGKVDYTISYEGGTAKSFITIKTPAVVEGFELTGALDPEPIVAWKNGISSQKYLDSGYCYFVGDDNAFRYELSFTLFDLNNMMPETRKLDYVSKSIVTLNGVEVGAEYVVIDEEKHTFDFTEAAIGKSFVITTSHKDYTEYTKSLEVTVVDGYNVYEAIELNLITNRNDFVGETASNYRMLEVIKAHLANHGVAGVTAAMTLEEYKAFVDGINGIILHDKFTLETSDFPEEFFFISESGDYYLWDHQSIFYREFTEVKLTANDPNPETFSIYGNYFTIISNNLPIVAPDGTINDEGVASNDDDGLSSSELIRFNISDTIFAEAKAQNKFYLENYVLNIYALGLHDNDPSLSTQPELAQLRSKLGIIALKFRAGTYNLHAVNAEAFFQTLTIEDFDMTTNIDYCSFYNAWNGHIMAWVSNEFDDAGSGSLDANGFHDGFRPHTINITNSFIGKCGGPVVISASDGPEDAVNNHDSAKVVLNIDDNSEVFSYVKGDEAWFVAYSATWVVDQIKAMNPGFVANGASFMADINGTTGFINFIYLNMDASFNPATGANASTDLDGEVIIGGETKLNMNDAAGSQQSNVKAYIDGINGMAPGSMPAYGQVPFFYSDNGGASFFNGQTIVTLADAAQGMLPGQADRNAALTGDYVTFFYYNLGMLFTFNEPALDAEPNPDTCDIVRITTAHGIN